ncbi:unnamed protein product [Ilex paraguariensis]|uniref:WRKY domain-containing protein n=1 Tax=Ilex paraguariensis TaxID=185542 RepID=A0ABC8SI69_9AQUA
MDEDWDLWTVVRSYRNLTADKASITNENTTRADRIPCLPLEKSEHLFSFPHTFEERNHGYEGLQEIYESFLAYNSKPVNTNANTTSFTVIDVSSDEQGAEPQPQPPQPKQPRSPPKLPPPINRNTTTTPPIYILDDFDDEQWLQPQSQSQSPKPLSRILAPPPQPPYSPPTQLLKQVYKLHSPPKPIKFHPYPYQRKKNLQVTVYELYAEELSRFDLWAWRKYGKKQIRGSLYPRNYYKCSNGEGKCQAKRHIQQSLSSPDKLIVSYDGEHIHSPPHSRNPLIGSSIMNSSASKKRSSSSPLPPPITSLLPTLGGYGDMKIVITEDPKEEMMEGKDATHHDTGKSIKEEPEEEMMEEVIYADLEISKKGFEGISKLHGDAFAPPMLGL